MEIKVKRVSIYAEVTVERDGVVINVGLFDDNERNVLADHLREVADELDTRK